MFRVPCEEEKASQREDDGESHTFAKQEEARAEPSRIMHGNHCMDVGVRSVGCVFQAYSRAIMHPRLGPTSRTMHKGWGKFSELTRVTRLFCCMA